MNSKLFVKGLSHRLDEDKRTAMKKNQANLFDDEKEKSYQFKRDNLKNECQKYHRAGMRENIKHP